MRVLALIWIFGLFYSAPTPAHAAEIGAETPSPHRVVFTYHSNFLLNLHHFLLDMATHDGKLDRVAWSETPTDAEMQVLRDAAVFYRANYRNRGLLFDPDLSAIKEALSGEDNRRTLDGLSLPQDLAAVLRQAVPIYGHCLWAAHDTVNRDWIAQIEPLDARYGGEIQAGIEHFMGHPFVTEPFRVDLVADTSSRNGAYTSDDPPHTLMPSTRADYQGLAALEMLYHESSHVHVTDTVEDAIKAELETQQRSSDNDLWHAVQFYTVGTVTQTVLKRLGGLDYQTYADKGGLYAFGKWPLYKTLIDTYWVPYLHGQTDRISALRAMADGLPRG
jgi:hypothetical protein